jgi:hypothetical protein
VGGLYGKITEEAILVSDKVTGCVSSSVAGIRKNGKFSGSIRRLPVSEVKVRLPFEKQSLV